MSSFPRICMVIPAFHPVVGGAERQCYKLSRELVKRGIQTTVLTFRHDVQHPRVETIAGISIHRIPLLRPVELNAVSLGLALVRLRACYDIIHVHSVGVHSFAAQVVGRLLAKPVIVKVANSEEHSDLRVVRRTLRWPIRSMILNGIRHYAAVISICTPVRKDLAAFGVSDRRVVGIPNGVEISTPTTDVERLASRRKLEIGPDVPVVLRLGTNLPKKGVETLLVAWKKITPIRPDALLLSVGGDEVPESITSLAAEMEGSVRLVPVQTNGVKDFLRAADVFVLPSFAEGLSNALLEAQASGLPSVATRVGGNPDIIEHGKNGLLMDANDPCGLSRCILELLSSKETRMKMRLNAGRRIARFLIERTTEKYTRLYHRLRRLSGHAAP